MKISDVKVYAGQMPDREDVVFVKVETDEGVAGWGEATLDGKEVATAEVARSFGSTLVGRDPFDIEHIWQELYRAGMSRGGPVGMVAISGIDVALWDLKGRALGVPVYNLLGGKARDRIRVYRHVGDVTDTAVARAKECVAEGFTIYRTALRLDRGTVFDAGRATRATADRVAQLRDAVGPDVGIVADVHTRLSPMEAVEFCDALLPYRPFFVEDPIRTENPAVFRLVRSKTKARLAGGARLNGKWAFRELIAENLVDYLRADLSQLGGITEAKKLASWAEAYHVEMALHCTASIITDMASAHLNYSIPNCAVQEHGDAYRQYKGVIEGGYMLEQGHMVLNGRPGLGLDINEDAIREMPPLRLARRPAGAGRMAR